jgi:hypothetical protein
VIVDAPDLAYAPSLQYLEVPSDPHLLVAVHIYTPVLFTFQGSPLLGPAFATTGVAFPGPPAIALEPAPQASDLDWVREWISDYNTLPAEQNPSGPSVIEELFAFVDAFATEQGLPIYFGEWGTQDGADTASRVRWMRTVRAAVEARGYGWSIWEDGNSFRLFDPERGVWQEELVTALFE